MFHAIKNNFLNAFLIFAVGSILACASNPNKAEKIDTKVDNSDHVTGDTVVGVKDGNMIVQRKNLMSEELRKLQNDVYSLEDRVYGNRQYGSLGLYGVLKDCKFQLSDKKNGGDGKLMWTEPIDRVTDKDEDMKMGLDDKGKLIAVSDEMLRDRIARFRQYRNVLEKRQDEYEEKLNICQADLLSRKREKEKTE